MGTIFLRDALIAARKPALTAALIVHAGLSALFLMAWGHGGVPILAGTIYDQLHRVQWALLLVALPWTAARVIAEERGDRLIYLSALAALPPSRLMGAKLLAATMAVLLVAAGALPVAILAQQMSAVPAARVVRNELALAAFAVAAAMTTGWWMQISSNRLAGWLAASACSALMLWIGRYFFPSMEAAAVAAAVVSLLISLVLSIQADVRLRYLSEPVS